MRTRPLPHRPRAAAAAGRRARQPDSPRRRVLLGSLLGSSAALLLAGSAAAQAPAPRAAEPIRVKLQTSKGDILLELYPQHAPQTVANFVQYVKDKHYDGTLFHRVISGFMIQGGGYDSRYTPKPTRAPVPHEGRQALASGGLRNTAGSIAMARTSDPQSATAQFFINLKDNPFLDPVPIPPGDPVPRFEYRGQVHHNVPRAALLQSPALYGYTVFGKVIAGMDVVHAIAAARTGAGGPFPSDVPQTPITILKATLEP